VEDIWTNNGGQIPTQNIDKIAGGGANITSATDLSASYKAVWDDTNLYYLIDVKDESKIGNASQWFFGDGVQIYFDPNNSKDATNQTTDRDLGVKFNDNTIFFGGSIPANSKINLLQTGSGYQYKIIIPFASLGITPAIDYLFGGEVAVNDIDGTSTTRDSILQTSTTNAGVYNNPSLQATNQLKGLITAPLSTQKNLSIKVNLQGAYNTTGSAMNNTIKNKNLIPLKTQAGINNDEVDWVTVELKQGGVVKETIETLLNSNGFVDITTNLPAESYHINIKHRNHLPISTRTPVNLVVGNNAIIDFTGNSNVQGSNQALLKPGVYGLKQGNSSGDLKINSLDRTQVRSASDASNVYSNNDLNMDGLVSSLDRSIARSAGDSTAVLN
jgi:hypothetical protein